MKIFRREKLAKLPQRRKLRREIRPNMYFTKKGVVFLRTTIDKPGTLYLGRQGENGVRELAFREPALWAEEFGEGTAQLLFLPPGGESAYPAPLELEDGLAVWRVAAAETSRAGFGSCELRWNVGERVAKSCVYPTFVSSGLPGGGAPAEDGPWESYLEQVARAGAQALAAAQRAENAVVHQPAIQDKTWWVWNFEAGGYEDTGVPASGGSGSNDHRQLTHRNDPSQHEMSAITGLREAIERIPAPTEPITNVKLEEILK